MFEFSPYNLPFGRLANEGTKLYIRTNEDAPQYKVVTLDLADETRERKVIIPEDKDAHLEDILPVYKDTFAVIYKRNVSYLCMPCLAFGLELTPLSHWSIQVKDEVYLYSFAGQRIMRLASDFVGAASVAGRQGEPDIFITMTGFTTPGVIARYDFNQQALDKRWSIYQTTFVNGLDPQDFISEQVGVATLSEYIPCENDDVVTGLVREQRWNENSNVHCST